MAEKEAQKIKTKSDYLSDSESSEDEVQPHLRTSQEERVYGTTKRIHVSNTGSNVSYKSSKHKAPTTNGLF